MDITLNDGMIEGAENVWEEIVAILESDQMSNSYV